MARSRGFRALGILLFAAVAPGYGGSPARGQELLSAGRYVPDQAIVRVEQARDDDLELLERAVGASGHERLFERDIWLLHLPPGSDVRATARLLESLPSVTYATPNAEVHVVGYPNDPGFGSQWALDQVTDVDIDAPEAWDLQPDAEDIVVAVIDSGAQLDHPDLSASIWTNPGEIPDNGIDDEGNGFIDDVHGYDFYNDDGDPSDDHGHGTYCGGILAAVTDNGLGVAGVCWKVRLMPLKFISASGIGTVAGAVRAVDYSMNNGAHLSSNSWVISYSESEVAPLADAIHVAWLEKGMLFVAASGNSGTDNDALPLYPASIPYPEVFAVAGSSQTDGLYGNWGRFSVDIAAPATNIFSTTIGSSYGWGTGTSAACPHVAGAVALVKARFPNRSLLSIKTKIMISADKRPAFQGKVASDGRLNLRAALASQAKLPGPAD